MIKIGQSSLPIRGDIKLHETTLTSRTAVGKFKEGTIHICAESDFITTVSSGIGGRRGRGIHLTTLKITKIVYC
jgi:hypothetical protein